MGEEEAVPFNRTPLKRTNLMFTHLITASLFAFLTICISDTSLFALATANWADVPVMQQRCST